MKKKILVFALAGALVSGTLSPLSALADSQKVVTLGADLTDDQKTAILTYFGILGDTSVETLVITNQDERDHLASYVPIEQIGTKTFSCALVNPTSSGGIQVKTANLNWVTGNMIATNLSTAGVKNCEVLAASPFEVSGTGALTGVIMAYEQATGTTLDEDKKELATQELVTTGIIADEVGQTTATNIVNEIKIQVIEGQVVDTQQVEEIVNEVVENSEAADEISEEVMVSLNELAEQIAQMQYEYEDMKDTLERVAENTSSTASITINNVVENNNTNTNDNSSNASSSSDTTVSNDSSSASSSSSDNAVSNDSTSSSDASTDTDSILNNTDASALGVDVIVTDTLEPETETEAAAESAEPEESAGSQESGIIITTSDEYTENAENAEGTVQEETTATADESTAAAESAEPEEITVVEETSAPVQEDTAASEENADSDQEELNVTTQDEYTFVVSDEYSEGDNSEDGSSEDATVQTEEAAAQSDEGAEEAENADNEAGEVQEAEEAPALTIDQESALTADVNTGIVTVYIPKADVKAVSGTLSVTDAYGNEMATIDIAENSDEVAAVAMSEEQLLAENWTEGTAILIHTGNIYGSYVDYTYSFNGTIASAEDETLTAAISVQETLATDDLGTGISLILNDISNLKVGSIVNGYYSLGESASYAEVSYVDDTYLAAQEVDGGFNLTLLQAGNTSFTVTFYDADWNVVEEKSYSITILEA